MWKNNSQQQVNTEQCHGGHRWTMDNTVRRMVRFGSCWRGTAEISFGLILAPNLNILSSWGSYLVPKIEKILKFHKKNWQIAFVQICNVTQYEPPTPRQFRVVIKYVAWVFLYAKKTKFVNSLSWTFKGPAQTVHHFVLFSRKKTQKWFRSFFQCDQIARTSRVRIF